MQLVAGNGRSVTASLRPSLAIPGQITVLAALAILTSIAALAIVQRHPIEPLFSPTTTATESRTAASTENRQRVLDAYAKLPLSFVPNVGQGDRRVRYYAERSGFGVFFTRKKVMLSLTKGSRRTTLALVPLGASASARLVSRREAEGKVNYFVGHERHANIPTYREIAYRDLWPGVDMVLRGQGGSLKYEFRVAAGADPSRIRLAYQGAEGLSVGAAGGLSISTPLGVVRDASPRSYQRVGGKRVPVDSRYVLDDHAYGFALGAGYDGRRPLVIDPGLTYSTFLGGSGNDRGIEVAVDDSGNAYVTGGTYSADFATSLGAVDTTYNGNSDAFVTKLDATGSNMVYSTLLGGSASESGLGIDVDGNGNAYMCAGTGSSDYPTTPGAFDTSHNGNEDVLVTKLNASGSVLLYSTFLGGSTPAGDFCDAIVVDANGRANITGGTGGGFPITAKAYDPTYNGGLLDAYVARLNPTGTGLAFSTYVGGAGHDVGTGIALGASGLPYITGDTDSPDYPTTSGVLDTSYGGNLDAFVTKLGGGGSTVTYSTYLGANGNDFGKDVAVDQYGRAFVAGWTASALFRTTAGAFDTTANGDHDGFVVKLNGAGTGLVYSTFLGGAGEDEALGIGIDSAGRAYVAGSTESSDFPTTAGALDTTANGNLDAFFTKLNAMGSAPMYSTYLGGGGIDFARGIAVGSDGSVFLPGRTESTDFPTTTGAFDTGFNGGVRDGFVAKITP
jgi:hypothetical protein